MKKKIFIGWDSREPMAYDVARRSFLRRTEPDSLQVIPIEIKHMDQLTRPIERRPDGTMWDPISQAPMSTEFAISRFLTPYLARGGWALYVDCDVLCLADVAELFALADPKFAVMCVKHEEQPGATGVKMDGQIQTAYARKNWSSVVLWNCDHPSNKALTIEMINTVPGRDLHRFSWLKDEEIGELPREWNYLVAASPAIAGEKKLLHFTLGGPWLKDWVTMDAQAENLWFEEAGRIWAKKASHTAARPAGKP